MMDEQQFQLVERIQSGDSTAENELFIKYKGAIHWKVCRQIKTGNENIEDLTSEINIAILEGLRKDSFQPGNWPSLEVYIWGVTNNKIRDWFKKRKVENRLFSDESSPDNMSEGSRIEESIENEELGNTLRDFLKQLDPKLKEVLDLRYFNELSVQQISEKLGIPARRVSERIHYALKRMHKTCKKEKNLSIFGFLMLLYLVEWRIYEM